MVKKLCKIGTSHGVVIDRPLLKMYKLEELVELIPLSDGILIRRPKDKEEEKPEDKKK